MDVAGDMRDKLEADAGAIDRGHDDFVREKVVRGLAQSRDRDAMIPTERVLRDLSA